MSKSDKARETNSLGAKEIVWTKDSGREPDNSSKVNAKFDKAHDGSLEHIYRDEVHQYNSLDIMDYGKYNCGLVIKNNFGRTNRNGLDVKNNIDRAITYSLCVDMIGKEIEISLEFDNDVDKAIGSSSESGSDRSLESCAKLVKPIEQT